MNGACPSFTCGRSGKDTCRREGPEAAFPATFSQGGVDAWARRRFPWAHVSAPHGLGGLLQVTVKLFSHLRLELGRSLTLDLAEGATVAEAIERIGSMASPELQSMIVDRERGGYRLVPLVNGRRSRPEALLAEGDTVSLLPPLGGG